MTALAEIARVAREVERWLLPAECLLCQEPVPEREGDALVCGLCRARWRPLPDPLCPRCGEPRRDPDPCRLCAEWPASLGRVRSAVRLEGGARALVHRLKYHGWWRAAEPMAASMRLLEPLTGRVCLIPIPLAPRRERERGYNQSERLATTLGRLMSLPVRTDVLRRVRNTGTQTALTPDERRANVAGAFAACASRAVRGRCVVLVDDVFTTGATLASAAEALSAAGAAQIEAVTFGRAG
ncbi:MAG TPA: double zinc ribbon domain-containing protein [Gemmatimonadales bacterium]|nr:double zinc ribbon domain-containing protein [Gemmatimonadales bacterium]